jgi:hypothetical protein
MEKFLGVGVQERTALGNEVIKFGSVSGVGGEGGGEMGLESFDVLGWPGYNIAKFWVVEIHIGI